ncbi:hypothetical protein BC670_2781 [Flavobacterium branchiophilum]|uniref:Uncharacterized protein n=1 Tax=Flavobacterium branchiophilum TaxID=55197 RepID=A0A543G6S1_9FLAO|nr:hypothetical protein BC670_2781 [Flavobacterium branchiophilum]
MDQNRLIPQKYLSQKMLLDMEQQQKVQFINQCRLVKDFTKIVVI